MANADGFTPGQFVSWEDMMAARTVRRQEPEPNVPTFSVNPDNPAQIKPSEPTQADYHVRDKGRGWFVVMQGDEEVTKSLREEVVTRFADLTADEQAAFVAEHKPD